MSNSTATGYESSDIIEILPEKLSICFKSQEDFERQHSKSYLQYQCDKSMMYTAFFADFGPLDLGITYKFCQKMHDLLNEAKDSKKIVIFNGGNHPHSRSNSAVLICAFLIFVTNCSVEQAYRSFIEIKNPFIPYRDAGFCINTFPITVLDCAKAMRKAKVLGHFNFKQFSLTSYQSLSKLQNGDISWIIPGKFIAFSGPLTKRRQIQPGLFSLTPEEYVPIFKKLGVSCIVRFNSKCYDRNVFTMNGIRHVDLFYEDGGNPTESILQAFLQLSEAERGAIAVHCKAGLGRTGTNIAAYMMKHYGYTARESTAWCRICRPGSIVGPQQQYLASIEEKMFNEGNIYREKNKPVVANTITSNTLSNHQALEQIDSNSNSTTKLIDDPGNNRMRSFSTGYNSNHSESSAQPRSIISDNGFVTTNRLNERSLGSDTKHFNSNHVNNNLSSIDAKLPVPSNHSNTAGGGENLFRKVFQQKADAGVHDIQARQEQVNNVIELKTMDQRPSTSHDVSGRQRADYDAMMSQSSKFNNEVEKKSRPLSSTGLHNRDTEKLHLPSTEKRPDKDKLTSEENYSSAFLLKSGLYKGLTNGGKPRSKSNMKNGQSSRIYADNSNSLIRNENEISIVNTKNNIQSTYPTAATVVNSATQSQINPKKELSLNKRWGGESSLESNSNVPSLKKQSDKPSNNENEDLIVQATSYSSRPGSSVRNRNRPLATPVANGPGHHPIYEDLENKAVAQTTNAITIPYALPWNEAKLRGHVNDEGMGLNSKSSSMKLPDNKSGASHGYDLKFAYEEKNKNNLHKASYNDLSDSNNNMGRPRSSSGLTVKY